jgi:hypothetical protein
MAQVKSYAATVDEVHSGDDLVVMVDLGVDKLFKKVRCRLAGVDTPNAYKAKGDSEAGLVRDEVKKLVADGDCRIEVVTEGKGGWLILLFVRDRKSKEEINVNDYLARRGFVYKGRADAASKSENSPGSARN